MKAFWDVFFPLHQIRKWALLGLAHQTMKGEKGDINALELRGREIEEMHSQRAHIREAEQVAFGELSALQRRRVLILGWNSKVNSCFFSKPIHLLQNRQQVSRCWNDLVKLCHTRCRWCHEFANSGAEVKFGDQMFTTDQASGSRREDAGFSRRRNQLKMHI